MHLQYGWAAAYPQKQNGNMLVERVKQLRLIQAITLQKNKQTMMEITIIITIQKKKYAEKQLLLVALLPMIGAYTTCMAMYLSGAAIGMATILQQYKPILQVQAKAFSVCFEAVVGATSLATAERLAVATTASLTSTVTS